MAVLNPLAKKWLENTTTQEKIGTLNSSENEGKSVQQIALEQLKNNKNPTSVGATAGTTAESNGTGNVQSNAAAQANDKLNSLQKPEANVSSWMEELNSVYDKIMNGEKFSYDINADALYQQYKDQYITQGQQAMMDTMGQAAALTGGYGNSYAQTVGQQTYQGYLQGLNNKIPELYQLALDQYNRERDDLYNQYALLTDREQTDYERYRDTLSDYYTERDYYTGRYDTEREYDYRAERDSVADSQWQQQFDEGVRQYDTSLAIQQEQWKAEYDESIRQADRNYELAVREIEEMVRSNKISEAQAQQQIELEKQKLAETKRQADAQLAYNYAVLEEEKRVNNSTIAKNNNNNNSKEEKKNNKNAKVDYSDWDAADWNSYFSAIRQSEGQAAAEAELKEFTSKGLIPNKYVSYAASGARGGKMGH